MTGKIIVVVSTVVLVMANAATTKRNLTLYQPTVVNGTELKAGQCKLEVDGNTAILRQGKQQVRVPIHVESTQRKFDSDTIRYAAGGTVREIDLRGTQSRIVIDNDSHATAPMATR